MKQSIRITIEEIEIILEKHKNISRHGNFSDTIELIKESGSGIGNLLDAEFQGMLDDEVVTVRVPITTVSNW